MTRLLPLFLLLSALAGTALGRDVPSRGDFSIHVDRALVKGGCADLFVNGSFEEPAIRDRSYAHRTSLHGWRLSSGSVFELQRNVFGSAADGQQYLELASNAPTHVEQAVATTPGDLYVLRFAYSARPGYADNEMEVHWGDAVVARLQSSGAGRRYPVWQYHAVVLTGYGPQGVVRFADTSAPDAGGAFLDALRLCRVECRNRIANPGFETPVLRDGSYRQPASIPGWDLLRGPAFELQRKLMGDAAEGAQYAELASSAPVAIAQTIPTTPGTSYLLRYAYSPRPGYPDNTVEVRWGEDLVSTATGNGRGQRRTAWREESAVLTATASTQRLSFADASRSDRAAGGFIDHVRLCPLLARAEPEERRPVDPVRPGM